MYIMADFSPIIAYGMNGIITKNVINKTFINKNDNVVLLLLQILLESISGLPDVQFLHVAQVCIVGPGVLYRKLPCFMILHGTVHMEHYSAWCAEDSRSEFRFTKIN